MFVVSLSLFSPQGQRERVVVEEVTKGYREKWTGQEPKNGEEKKTKKEQKKACIIKEVSEKWCSWCMQVLMDF